MGDPASTEELIYLLFDRIFDQCCLVFLMFFEELDCHSNEILYESILHYNTIYLVPSFALLLFASSFTLLSKRFSVPPVLWTNDSLCFPSVAMYKLWCWECCEINPKHPFLPYGVNWKKISIWCGNSRLRIQGSWHNRLPCIDIQFSGNCYVLC